MTTPFVKQAMSVLNTDVLVGEVPANGIEFGTVTILLANISDTQAADCKIYIGNGNAPEAKFVIDPKSSLAPNGGQTFSCITVMPGEKIWVRATTSNVAINVRGLLD